MFERKKVIILCKTYPSPSGKYTETSCVAGVTDGGDFIRLFPVPFRYLDDDKQFKKWQWVEVECEKARMDHRPESHSLNVDGIRCLGLPLKTTNGWRERLAIINRLYCSTSFEWVKKQWHDTGTSLSLLKPSRILGFDIKPSSNPDWTDDELKKLKKNQQQAGLFNTSEKTLSLLKKIPFDFYYRYRCGDEEQEWRHKVVDWEVGALFWNCRKRYKDNWERPFRKTMEVDMPKRDLLFLLGNIHRWPDRWLIVSLIYPPQVKQLDLFSSI